MLSDALLSPMTHRWHKYTEGLTCSCLRYAHVRAKCRVDVYSVHLFVGAVRLPTVSELQLLTITDWNSLEALFANVLNLYTIVLTWLSRYTHSKQRFRLSVMGSASSDTVGKHTCELYSQNASLQVRMSSHRLTWTGAHPSVSGAHMRTDIDHSKTVYM